MAGLTHSPLSDFQGSGVANASTVINGDSLEDASSSSFLGGGGETRRNSLSNPPKQALSVDVPEDTKDSEAEADAPELLYTPLSEGWKKIVVIIAGVTGMLAPFCSNIFLPALHIVADDLNSTVERINVAVSVFMIGLGVAPIFWGPMADQFGRRYSYSLGCLVCALASVGCALAESDSLLLGMRFLQAFGGSATIVVGAGSISDVYEPAQRGGALGVFFSAQMLGPVLGTIIGGYVAENLGWRWTFWLSVIISGVFCAIVTFIMPETHRVTMARRYQMPLKGLPADIHLKPRPPITLQQINPFAIAPTLKFKYVSLPTLCTALIFGSFYSMNTAVSTILADQYHYSTSNIGLCYIAIGVGCISGALIGGIMADKNYTRLLRRREVAHQEQYGPLSEANQADGAAPNAEKAGEGNTGSSGRPAVIQPFEGRLLFVIFTMAVFPLSLIAFGWVMHFHVHLVFPLICMFVTGFCLNASFGGISTYLVDLFTIKSSSITSLANLFRCLYAALWTGIIQIVMNSWGSGWAFTFLGFTCLVGSASTLLVFIKGEQWRTEHPPTAFLDVKQ